MHGRGFYQLSDEIIDEDYGKVWEATVEYVGKHIGPIDYIEGQRISISAPEPVIELILLEELKSKIEDAQFRNQGNKVATLNHLRHAENHFEKVLEELQKGNVKEAEQQQKLGYNALQKVQKEIEKQSEQVMGAEVKENLLTMIEAIITQMRLR